VHAYPNKEGGGPRTDTKLPENPVAGDFYDGYEVFVLTSKHIYFLRIDNMQERNVFRVKCHHFYGQ
jgi:hypothetical protein